MTVNEQSRGAFETWAREQPKPLNLGFGNGGYYYAPETIDAWAIWQAAQADLLARNAELEAERDALAAKVGMRDTTIRKWWKIADEFEAIADALAAENKALRRAFPKPRNRCCMNCAEHGSCNPDGLNGCAYDDSGEDYDRGWNDCLDAALARTPANGDAAWNG